MNNISFNIIDVILIALFALAIFWGYKKGLVRSLVSMLKFFIAVPSAFFAANNFSDPIYDSYVKDFILKKVQSRLSNSSSFSAFITDTQNKINLLPFNLGKAVNTDFLSNLNTKNAALRITDTVIEPIAKIIIRILLFVLTVIIIYVITFIISQIIKHFEKKHKKSTLTKANRITGASLSALKAIFIMFVLSSVISYLSQNLFKNSDSSFLKMLSNSFIISAFSKINPFSIA